MFAGGRGHEGRGECGLASLHFWEFIVLSVPASQNNVLFLLVKKKKLVKMVVF